jgi:cysteine desulfurase family protein (TIGR01976 family)
MRFDVEAIRTQFPSLQRVVNGQQAIYFDSPGGTQTPKRVIDAMVDYMLHHNANSGGVFIASVENDAIIVETRKAFADFFNCDWKEVSFGENATNICFRLSHALVRDLQPGDEILITDMDHDANRTPWQMLAERGMIVKAVNINPSTCLLDMEDYKNKLSHKTKVVAFNYASNAVGTISNAKEIIALAKQAGAITVVDAVHYALHGVIDVKEIEVDYLFCSAYKFFGPHIGVLYARAERMEKLRPLKVLAQKKEAPDKFETGTLNHEGIAGAGEAMAFIASIGAQHRHLLGSQYNNASERRKDIVAGMLALEEYEMPLASYFKDALRQIDGLTLYGPPKGHPCTSTISFRLKHMHPLDVARRLAEKGIFVWAGGFYALGLVKTLGVHDRGGMVRIGLAPYNTKEEIDRALEEIRGMVSGE